MLQLFFKKCVSVKQYSLLPASRSFATMLMALLLALTSPAVVVADGTFPSKPIRVIVPFKPGGRTDTVARLLGEKIQEKGWLSQPMVVLNAAGGAGANAVAQMRRGDADGHTVVHWHHQLLIIHRDESG